ncbi:hypothetical protein JR053_03190 [Wolbachia endosymbiont of Nasonia vitripennis]|uniref:hypothetical protein n=1 Tax=Wolbachia endosymbiont of Nasonia vitripennis TaxID=180837 RepID=UPI003A8AEF7A
MCKYRSKSGVIPVLDTGIQFSLPKVFHSITQNPYLPNRMHYLQSRSQCQALG